MSDLENSTSVDGQEAATVNPPAPAAETVQPGGEGGGGAPPAEEGFTNVDPKTLPPQLRAAYNNMLTDYKGKTTKLAETIKAEVAKATAASQEKAGFYDQIATQEEFVKQWNAYVQKTQAQSEGQPGVNPEFTQLQQQIQEINQKVQLTEMAQITNAFADAVDEKGQKINGDFDVLNQMIVGEIDAGKGIQTYSLLRAAVELAKGATADEKLVNGYKAAKQVYDSIFESGRKAGMGRLQSKVQNSSLPPSHSTDELLTLTEKRPKNASEALEMARKGIMVSR